MSGECPPLLAPASQNCSGRGICLSQFACACEPGWTGVGDFVFGSPTCDINIAAIKAMWSVLTVVHLIQMVLALLFLRIKLKQKKLISKLPIAMGAFYFTANVLFVCVGIIRASDTLTRTIGTDPGVTVLFCLAGASYWTMIHLFVLSFIEVVHKQAMFFQHRTERIIPVNQVRRALSVSACLSVFFCLAPLGMLSASDQDGYAAFAQAHYLGLGCAAFLVGIVIVPGYGKKLEAEIRSGRDALTGNVSGNMLVPLQRLLFKVSKFNKELLNQVIPQFSIALLFGIWPFLRVHGTSYWLPIAWTLATFIATLIMYVNVPVQIVAGSSSPPVPQATATTSFIAGAVAVAGVDAGPVKTQKGNADATQSNNSGNTAALVIPVTGNEEA